jgi:hypothetical protein
MQVDSRLTANSEIPSLQLECYTKHQFPRAGEIMVKSSVEANSWNGCWDMSDATEAFQRTALATQTIGPKMPMLVL